tara:strand:- start:29371 stop:29541 length:171 start_codon:yes stop_codon:yes gene_type:complete
LTIARVLRYLVNAGHIFPKTFLVCMAALEIDFSRRRFFSSLSFSAIQPKLKERPFN